jgi:hypothetical protein
MRRSCVAMDGPAAAGMTAHGAALPSGRACLVAFSLLLAVGMLTFAPTLRNGFILDDDYMIVHNPAIRSLANLPGFFTSVPPGSINRSYYRPIMLSSFTLDHALFGSSARALHGINIVWHVSVALLVWVVLQQLGAGRGAASLAALLFVVHPVQGEVVYLINNRSNSVAAAFFLLGLCLYLRCRAQAWSPITIGALALCYFCALGGKESGATLPLVMLAVDWLLPSGKRPVLAPYLTCAAVLLGYIVIRQILCDPVSASYFDDQSGTAVLRALVVVEAYALSLLVYPRGLAGTYDYTHIAQPTSFGDPLFVTCAVLLFGLIVVGYTLRRRSPRVALGIAIHFITLLPTYHIIRLPILFGERFLYLPMLGACLILCVALDALAQTSFARVARAGLVGLACVFAAHSHARAYDWRSEVSYWRSVVEMRPQSLQAHIGLANALSDAHRCKQALPHYLFAVTRVPPVAAQARPLYGQTASCLSLTGDQRGALAIVNRWLAAQPNDTGFARMRSVLARGATSQ